MGKSVTVCLNREFRETSVMPTRERSGRKSHVIFRLGATERATGGQSRRGGALDSQRSRSLREITTSQMSFADRELNDDAGKGVGIGRKQFQAC